MLLVIESTMRSAMGGVQVWFVWMICGLISATLRSTIRTFWTMHYDADRKGYPFRSTEMGLTSCCPWIMAITLLPPKLFHNRSSNPSLSSLLCFEAVTFLRDTTSSKSINLLFWWSISQSLSMRRSLWRHPVMCRIFAQGRWRVADMPNSMFFTEIERK